MKQLTKLHMFIFELLVWTGYGTDFYNNKTLKKPPKFAKCFYMHCKMRILKHIQTRCTIRHTTCKQTSRALGL